MECEAWQSKKEFGIATLRALRKGELPPKLDKWPDQEVSAKPVVTESKRSCEQAAPSASKVARYESIPLGSAFPMRIDDSPTVSIEQQVTQPTIPSHVFISNMQDLVELAEYGERVVWPGNLDLESAKQLIAENPIVQIREQ